MVNDKPYEEYFTVKEQQKIIQSPIDELKMEGKFSVLARVKGGGKSAQAQACRHAIARALEKLNSYFRKPLKKVGFLTRDPRMRERKKPGLKRARRAPQWSKR